MCLLEFLSTVLTFISQTMRASKARKFIFCPLQSLYIVDNNKEGRKKGGKEEGREGKREEGRKEGKRN